jgi:Cytochrome P460
MKSTQMLLLIVALGALGVACVPQSGAEYIAQDDDFANYTKWTLVDKVSGNSDQLKGAHVSDQPDTTRTIFIKGNADRTDNGRFPVGTTLVKHYTDKSNKLLGATAMVKRGNGFNKEGGGWEWFVLDVSSGKIANNPAGAPIRGAIAMCNQCHVKTEENDFVFTR